MLFLDFLLPVFYHRDSQSSKNDREFKAMTERGEVLS